MIRPKYETPKPSRADENDAYELVTLRDRGVCVRCRRVHPLFGVNRDHRKGRGVGGVTTPGNLQLLCGSGTDGCHGWKTNNPAEALAQGYTVPGWADPLIWPARRWTDTGMGTLRQVWCLYRNDGTWDRITDEDAARRMGGSI